MASMLTPAPTRTVAGMPAGGERLSTPGALTMKWTGLDYQSGTCVEWRRNHPDVRERIL